MSTATKTYHAERRMSHVFRLLFSTMPYSRKLRHIFLSFFGLLSILLDDAIPGRIGFRTFLRGAILLLVIVVYVFIMTILGWLELAFLYVRVYWLKLLNAIIRFTIWLITPVAR